jgi:hypothetical protein
MIRLLADGRSSFRFDVRQFHRILASGVFGDQMVELVAGRIFPMTDLPPHVFAVGRIHEAFRPLFPRDRWTIREEKPILIGRYWAPKPDLALLRGDDTVYANRQPRPGDVALLLEVSDTTYRRDRGLKWRQYAAASIPIYIIVRLRGLDTILQLWTGPTGRGKSACYTDVVTYSARAGESVPIEFDGTRHGQIALIDLIAR